MTSKLFLCLGVLFSTAIAGHAQDRRTLQISEVDTILLNPTTIEYLVSVNRNSDLMDVVRQKKGMPNPEATPASMAIVMNMLRDHHIAWTTGGQKGYSIGQFGVLPDSSIAITVHSEAELNSVYMLLSPLSGVSAKLGQIQFEPMPDRVSIYKTIYERAVADATGMARISGKTLGELISVEEPQDLLWSMHDMTEGIQNSANFIAELSGKPNATLQKKLEVKMLFKFELK